MGCSLYIEPRWRLADKGSILLDCSLYIEQIQLNANIKAIVLA